MNKQQATALIRTTFENAFDEDQYLRFLRELFNGQIDESDDRKFDYYGQYIPDSFKDSVRRYKRLGTYTDPDGNEIDLLIVILKRDGSLDRARTMQRNFAAYHLKRREKETAIIAYTTEERSDWRFSMVRREPVVAFSEKGNLIAKDELTPVRRYSFLVGKSERSHTAQQQLFPILLDDKHDPTLDGLEEAFNIETVTKEFFERYKALFLQLKEELDRLTTKDRRVQAEFEAKELDTANFAKKLLGQIVFLYFLQKKGWLGVTVDGKWGEGSKSFLPDQFRNLRGRGNFFNNILQPLFYRALAIDRSERDNIYEITPELKVKIPFLNGGLFEPMNNYDWQNTAILIDNEVFEDIFETFDLYNFTVREDEPLEKEVAVDPEMLGKVFENLLEVTDRKSKGAFYTPREIVHYMCQESLINYLSTAMGDVIPREDLAIFIRVGELAVQNDTAKEAGTVSYTYQMPESIRTHAKKLDTALASIKICDPAIGSGAFPVGMMQEIIKAREVLTTYVGNHWLPFDEEGERNLYTFKRQAIQESIYGVDIDPGAIDIAKLRLWLSLVVDEDDYHNIKPLPNLDYKIVCGNSLLAYLYQRQGLETFEALKQQFFDETDVEKKNNLRKQIESTLHEIYANTKKSLGYQVDVDFRINFSEVFRSKGGFDVIIGNPPYLRIQGIQKENPELASAYKNIFDSATGSFDLYVLFVEKGLEILNPQGQLNFIMPDKWTNAAFGKGLRKVISEGKAEKRSLEHSKLVGQHAYKLISFGAYQIFNASTYSSLLWLTKHPNPHLMYFGFDQDLSTSYELASALNRLQQDSFYPIEASVLSEETWTLTNRSTGTILAQMEYQTRRLSEVFSKIFVGLQTSKDSVYFLTDCKSNGNLVEGYSRELNKRVLVEQGLMKPLLKGDQVHRYVALQTANCVLFPYRIQRDNRGEKAEVMSPSYIQKSFPRGWAYLLECEEPIKSRENGRLSKDQDWYRYIYPKNGTLFEKEKLVSPDISLGGNFAYDSQGQFYMTTTVYGYIKNASVREDYRFWLALMNSKLVWFYLQNTGTVLANGYFRYKPAYLENFPVPQKIGPKHEQIFVTLADYISHIKAQVDTKSSAHARDAVMVSYFEQIIDALVYELYFPDELHSHDRYFMHLLERENLPALNQPQENQIRQLRQIFERLFETNHPLRQNLFFLDNVSIIRAIEGKE